MGASDWREAYSMDLYAREAFAVAEAQGLLEADETPVFAGHSFGGRVALRCAAGPRGQGLKCAVAIDTLITPPGVDLGPSPFEPRRARVYPSREAILARFRLIPPQPCLDRRLVDYVAGLSIREVDDPALGAGWIWRFDPALWTHFDDVRSIEDLSAALCPVAAIRGAKSALMVPPVTGHFDAHAPPGTPIVTVPEGHHHLMLDQPLALVAAVNGLLAGWPRAAAR
jgi:pimeloyl-ACP methyl ester carboxylesterase